MYKYYFERDIYMKISKVSVQPSMSAKTLDNDCGDRIICSTWFMISFEYVGPVVRQIL